jgi:hypothetical protein
MNTPVLSRVFIGRRRRLGIAVALLVTVASVGLAPTAFGQSGPNGFGQSGPTAPGQSAPSPLRQFPFNPFERDARSLCAGRGEPNGTAPFLRTELYFGSNKPDGSAVTPNQFQQFLNAEITPRFPDGLTLLTGLGQFKSSSGVIERERSMQLILLYPVDTARASGQKIEEIRAAYEKQFQQESVLRADEPLPECVSF